MDHLAANAAARERILGLVSTLTDQQLQTPIGDDWTIAAELAHLAFWERIHVGRLRRAVAAGDAAPPPMPDGLTDIINNGELPAWRQIPGRNAVGLFEAASAEVDGFIRSLDPAAVEAVKTAGMPRLVERFRHRNEHGDAIEGAL